MRLASIRRRGVAILFAVVVFATLGAVSGTAIWQFIAGRRALERRANVVQAAWLARSAAHLAAARLARDGKDYSGESFDLLPGWTVQADVEAPMAGDQTIRLRTLARMTPDDRNRVSIRLNWLVRLHQDSGRFALQRDDSESIADGQ